MMAACKCGCGATAKSGRTFVDKEHQLEWMLAGGARELNALSPLEARVKGGEVAGQEAQASGRLAEAGRLGAAKSREIAERFRERRSLAAQETTGA